MAIERVIINSSIDTDRIEDIWDMLKTGNYYNFIFYFFVKIVVDSDLNDFQLF